jgi:hypothetical protein
VQRKFSLKKIFFLFAFLSIHFNDYSQSLSKSNSPYLGITNLSTQNRDVFSFTSNQAALAGMKNFSAGINSEQRFMLKELTTHQFAVTLPTHSGNFGLHGIYSGFADYNETSLGLAYARSLGDKIDVGVQFNYNVVKIAGYGNASAINFELGTIIHLTQQLNCGVHLYSPVAGRFGKDKQEKIPSIYSAGFGFEPSEKFIMSLLFEKQEGELLNVNAGFQYKILQQVFVRFGISSAASSIFFGAGYNWKNISLHATASYHQLLGISPGLVFIFNSKTKQD